MAMSFKMGMVTLRMFATIGKDHLFGMWGGEGGGAKRKV